MTGATFRYITAGFCVAFGLLWIYFSIKQGGMYVPPKEVQEFMVLLLGGKLWQSLSLDKAKVNG